MPELATGPPRQILACQGPQYRVGIIFPPLVEIGLRRQPKLGKDQSLASLAALAALCYFKNEPYLLLTSTDYLAMGPFKYYVSKEVGGGGGQQMAIFADLRYYLC